jgi:hypothetical protein
MDGAGAAAPYSIRSEKRGVRREEKDARYQIPDARCRIPEVGRRRSGADGEGAVGSTRGRVRYLHRGRRQVAAETAW